MPLIEEIIESKIKPKEKQTKLVDSSLLKEKFE